MATGQAPSDSGNNNQPNQSNQQTNKQKSYSAKIVEEFKRDKLDEDIKYFEKTKEEIAEDFVNFVQLKHKKDGSMLKKLQQNGIDVAFNEIADKGFRLSDFTLDHKKTHVEKVLKQTSSEKEAIEKGLLDCYNNWKGLSNTTRTQLNFSDFISQLGIQGVDDGSNANPPIFKSFHIIATTKPAGLSAGSIKNAWNIFVDGELKFPQHQNNDNIKNYLGFGQWNSTEKLSCIASVQKLREKLNKLDGNQRTLALQEFETIFGKDIEIGGPISCLHDRTNTTGLIESLKKIFNILEEKRFGIDNADLISIKNTRVTANDLIKVGREHKELDVGNYKQGNYESKRFSEMSDELADISNAMFEADLLSNYEGVLDEVHETTENYMSTMNLPGNLKDFFGQFGMPNAIKKSSSSKELRRVKQQMERLRERMGSGTLSPSEKNAAQQQYDTLKAEADRLNTTESVATRDAYFDHIATQIDAACDDIGVDIYGSRLKTILHKLKDNRRNVTKILQAEQGLIMKAAIDYKLSTMKKTDILGQTGQSFDLYRQFVSNLYDFESDTAELRFQTGEKVVIKFAKDKDDKISKKLVGKPAEFDSVDIQDLSSLEKIRVEFEVDLDSSSEDAATLLKVVTGNTVIRKFFKKTNFPETITDSTLVEVEDKFGTIHTGYLSPSGVGYGQDNIDLGDGSPDQFILYSEPADKLKEQRTIQVLRNKDGKEIDYDGKSIEAGEKPHAIVIGSNNLSDFRSVRPIQKRATLSNNSLSALTLAHKLAEQSKTKEQKALDTVFEELKKNDEEFSQAAQETKEDTRDLGESSENKEVKANALARARDSIFAGAKDDDKVAFKDIQQGTRVALRFKDKKGEKGEKDTKFDGMIAITVKSINKNPDNLELTFENLDYPAQLNYPTQTWDARQLMNLSDKITSSKSIKLPNSGVSSEEQFNKIAGKDARFQSLVFGDKEIKKGKETVQHFINVTGDKQEYMIIPKGNGQYEISGRNAGDKKDKDGKNVKVRYTLPPFTTSLAGVLLFIKHKGLSAYTDAEKQVYETAVNENPVIPQKDNKRWSPSALRTVIKGDGKKLIDQFKKKYTEESQAELRYRMFVEGGIYRKLQGVFGNFLEKFELDAFDDLADEAEAGGITYGWDKINGYYEHLGKFHHGNNINVGDLGDDDVGKGSGSSRMVYDMIKSAGDSHPNLKYKQRLKVAGSLLHMLEKFKSGYSKQTKDFQKGTYVKLLLGEDEYINFINVYKTKEAALLNGPEGNLLQDQLAFLEYNYIVDNIRGGSLDNKAKKNPGYFQRLYGRKFANELGTKVSQAKQVDMNPSGDKVKGIVETADFKHVMNDYMTQIANMRVEEALQNIVALQQMAKNKEQQNEVIKALIAGFLNGTFVRNIGAGTKAQLKSLARNLGIIRGKWTEHYNAPEKLTNFLMVASGGQFANFQFGDPKRNYHRSDFAKHDRDKKILADFPSSFVKGEGFDRNQVLTFMSGENIQTEPEHSMVHIWKAEKAPVVYKRQVTAAEKADIGEIMNDFYFNKDRGADINILNYAPGFYNHRTMIENHQQQWNNLDGGNFKGGTMDHAETYRTAINNNLPIPGRLAEKQKDMLWYHVDEFFRTFQGIGNIKYTSQQIGEFYKYIRLAQKQKSQKNTQDFKRLVWAQPIMNAYASGDGIPPIVSRALAKSLKFFEENIDLFGPDTGKMHIKPGLETNPPETFESIFTENQLFDYNYIPRRIWQGSEKAVKNKRINQERDRSKLLINEQIDNLKDSRRGGGRAPINIDNIILQLNNDNFHDDSYSAGGQGGAIADSDNSNNVILPGASSNQTYTNDPIGNASNRPVINQQDRAAAETAERAANFLQ